MAMGWVLWGEEQLSSSVHLFSKQPEEMFFFSPPSNAKVTISKLEYSDGEMRDIHCLTIALELKIDWNFSLSTNTCDPGYT